MKNSKYQAIPSTSELLDAVKPTRPLNAFDRVERLIFSIVVVLVLVMVIVSILLWLKWIESSWAMPLEVGFVLATTLLGSIWMFSQLIEASLAWKAGFKPYADSVDARIFREREIVDRLVLCDPAAVRERAKHMNLEAKLTTRRAAVGVAMVAVFVTALNIHDSGTKAAVWPKLSEVPVFVYAAAMGLSIGAIILSVLAGRLERVAGLMELAADRSKSD